MISFVEIALLKPNISWQIDGDSSSDGDYSFGKFGFPTLYSQLPVRVLQDQSWIFYSIPFYMMS